jgi:hypothetical protein
MAVIVRDTTNVPLRDSTEIELPKGMRLLRGVDALNGEQSPVPSLYSSPGGDLWEILRFKGTCVAYAVSISRKN